MPPTIRILSENLCNQISAGEVVERPLSVVKELVENSLDAGATEIRVLVEKGGKNLIRVEDNGIGMSRDDLFLCLERHATSKIASAEDLFRLRTLGFRGEALPSVAAVSRMRLASRTETGAEGFEIQVEGGTVKKAVAAGIPSGTVVEVRNLFFNTPARKKFLKSENTEFGHIADFISKIALSFPQVQLSLEHNQRGVINLFRHHSLADRVIGLLGREIFSKLVPVENVGPEGLKISGFLGLPDLQRKSASAIHSFVNRRFVRDRLFQHAVMEGYRSLLPRHHFPVVVLFLDIAPDLVDVNVHPTKREVRFRQQGLVHDFVADSVQDVLRRQKPVGEKNQTPSFEDSEPLSITKQKSFSSYLNRDASNAEKPAAGVAEGKANFFQHSNLRPFSKSDEAIEKSSEVFSFQPDRTEDPSSGFFSNLALLGQFHHSYIVCRSSEELVLIDQHAAHERIGFERLKTQYEKGKVEVQELLFPKILEFSFQEASVLEGNLETLFDFGLSLEPYGGKTFVLRGIPALLDPERGEQIIKEILEDLSGVGRTRAMTHEVEKILVTMACHSMVRANQVLSTAEMKTLLQEMDRFDFTSHCPHGRPAVVRFSLRDIEKMFHRP